MKILEKILYFIAILFALLCMFILICSNKPAIAKNIARFLYPAEKQAMAEERAMEDEMPQDDDGLEPESPSQPEETAYMPENDNGENTAQKPDWDYDLSLADDEGEGIIGDVASEYNPPSESGLIIPQNVSGRNGYEEIQAENEQVEEDEAEQIYEQLALGNTGDGLTFDPVYYPYYAMLDDTGKHLYRQIYANANDLYDAFAPVEKVTMRQLRNIFSAVFNDHPELFWMQTGYACKYAPNGQCAEIDLKFNRTARNLDSEKATFEEKAENIAAQARGLSSDYEKEKFVHDTLIDSISYDLGAEMNQSAYSALVNGQTVCAGYARAFQYVLQKLDIPCYYCTGFAGENHAWNIVSLDDGYYNVDTTWDDVDGGNYDYFNKTDADYASNHIRKELSVYLPPCNGQKYRGLEPEPETDTNADDGDLRSLSDVGMTEDQVITDMERYYQECYDQILANGKGDYTFNIVIGGDTMLDSWYRAYENEDFWDAFVEDAVRAVGGTDVDILFVGEQLQGDRYLLQHKISIWNQ